MFTTQGGVGGGAPALGLYNKEKLQEYKLSQENKAKEILYISILNLLHQT